jgi:hypothetical protein
MGEWEKRNEWEKRTSGKRNEWNKGRIRKKSEKKMESGIVEKRK